MGDGKPLPSSSSFIPCASDLFVVDKDDSILPPYSNDKQTVPKKQEAPSSNATRLLPKTASIRERGVRRARQCKNENEMFSFLTFLLFDVMPQVERQEMDLSNPCDSDVLQDQDKSETDEDDDDDDEDDDDDDDDEDDDDEPLTKHC